MVSGQGGTSLKVMSPLVYFTVIFFVASHAAEWLGCDRARRVVDSFSIMLNVTTGWVRVGVRLTRAS